MIGEILTMRHRVFSALCVTTLIAGCTMATGSSPQTTSSIGLSAGNAQLLGGAVGR